METFYADTEGGAYLQDPARGDLIDLIEALDTSVDTFLVVHPHPDEADWFFSISKKAGTFGGYKLHRHDPNTGEDTITTAAAPTTVADDVLNWVARR